MLYIDVTRLYNTARQQQQFTGIDRVTIAYIQYFGKQACAMIRLPKYWLFFPLDYSQKIFHRFLTNQPLIFPKNSILKKLNRLRYQYPSQDNHNYLLHIYHGGLEKPNFLNFMQNYRLKGIYFLHDLIPIDYPEYCREGEKFKHEIRLNTMRQGSLLLCNSRYTQSRWLSYCQQHHWISPPTAWAHLAASDNFANNAPNNINNTQLLPNLFAQILSDKPYFLILGTIEGRKNHLLLLNVWRALSETLGDACPRLVIVGKRGWECEQVLAILDRSETLKSVIIEINDCNDSDLAYILANAKALLFPSFVEGFGLPLVEAFAARIPVIASDIPAFREIDQAHIAKLISPLDTMAWQAAILDFLSPTSTCRNEQIAKLANFDMSDFIWERHFAKVADAMQTYLALEY